MTSKYSSTSVETTLQNAITTSGATSMVVSSGTGSALMGGVTLDAGNVDIFTVAIDVDTINEEIVFITNQSSDTMTIVRGRAGSSAVTHSAGATSYSIKRNSNSKISVGLLFIREAERFWRLQKVL